MLVRARELFAESARFTRVNKIDDKRAETHLERCFNGVRQAGVVAATNQPVHDNRDVVFVLLLESRRFGELNQLTVDECAGEALPEQIRKHIDKLTFTPRHYWCENLKALVLFQFGELVGDVLCRLTLNRVAALGTVRDSDASPQQTHVVVDLGDCSDRRPWVSVRRLLVNRDRG